MQDDSQPLGSVDRPPWRLSGVVVGAALNDPGWLAALGAELDAAPYKGAPKAPVLYVKPRHCFARADAPMRLPRGAEAIEVGATIGLLVGATACRVDADEARRCISGHLTVGDLGLPLASWYRPAARSRALDGSLRIGAACAPRVGPAGEGFVLRVWIDGRLAQQASTESYTRGPARLLSDVSQFMTLGAGDLLLLGVPHGAPLARAGQRVRVEAEGAEGLGALEFGIEAAR